MSAGDRTDDRRDAWSAGRALAATYRFVDRLAAANPGLLGRMADVVEAHAGAAADPTVVSAAALLTDAFEHLFGAPIDRARQRVFAAHAGSRVLDYGCGAGFYALDLALRGRRVTCVEVDALKLEFVRTAAAELGVTERVDFSAAGVYDTVICVNVLDHLPDASTLVPSLAASLRPDGDLFLYAHFTNDGVHTSDPAVIRRTFDALAAAFRRAPHARQPDAALEWWTRRGGPAAGPSECLVPEADPWSAERRRAFRPLAHPGVTLRPMADGRSLAEGNRFYLRRAALDATARTVLELCDGAGSVDQVAVAAAARGIPQDRCLALLRELWARRYVSMLVDQGEVPR